MAALTVRQLDPELKERLRVRAAQNGHSMEAEARAILKAALEDKTDQSGKEFVRGIRALFEPLGGVELELPPRGPGREPPSFE